MMKCKSIKFLILIVLFCCIGCFDVLAVNNIEIENISVNENQVSITGTLGEGVRPISCLVTDSTEKIAYVSQTESDADGNFAFEFNIPEWAVTGTYTVKCGGDAPNSPTIATFEYKKETTDESDSKIEILSVEADADGKVTVNGKIDGENKSISCLVTDSTEKIAYVSQTESDTDGNFAFEFNMPEWAVTGTYTVKCGGEASNSPATATFEYEKETTDESDSKIEILSVEADADGKVTVNGKIYGGNKSISCLVTDSTEKIAYVSQTESDTDGNFAFEFNMPEWAITGTYAVKCGGEVSNSPATATFEYKKETTDESDSKIEILSVEADADGKVTVNGKIDGGNRSISCLVTDSTEKIVYVSQTESDTDGNFAFEFNMPEWAVTGTYTVKCGGDASNSPAIATFEYKKETTDESDSKIEILSVEADADGKVTVNDKIDGGNKSISCLVTDSTEKIVYVSQTESDTDGNFAFEFNMPEWAITGTYAVKCGGDASNSPATTTFEYEKIVEEIPVTIEIIAVTMDENGNVTVSGTSSAANDTITCILADSSGEQVLTEQKTAEEDGSFSFSFVMPIWSEAGIYTIECANSSTSVNTSVTYNKTETIIEETDINKNENAALYTALKKECEQLDADKDGIITVAELNSLTGAINLSNRNISDINGLQALIQVSDIYLNNNKIENIDVLGNLSNLQRLDVSNNNISVINMIPKNLTALHMENNNIKNADIIRKCRKLVYLFADNNNISDIEFVKVMADLKTLSMERNNIADISWIENCTDMRYLNLSNNGISDVSAIANCTVLYDLRLSNNNITDISALINNTYSYIDIYGNDIDKEQRVKVVAVRIKF